MSKIGRNDPCPCGSGKKYKKCCLRKEQAASPLSKHPSKSHHDRCVGILDSLQDRIMRFAENAGYFKEIKPAQLYYLAYIDPQGPSELDENEFVAFIEWFVHDYEMPEEGRTIAQLYLASQPTLPAEEMQVLRQYQESYISVYRIGEVQPGQGFQAKDLFSEEEFFLSDETLSHRAKPGYIIITRLTEVMGEYHASPAVGLCEGKVWPALERNIQAALQEFQNESPDAGMQRFLKERGFILNSLLLASAEQAFPGPKLVTTSGEEPAFHQARYDLLDRSAAIAALQGTQDFDLDDPGEDPSKADELHFVWLDQGETVPLIRAMEAGFRSGHDKMFGGKPGAGSARLLGTITIKADRLLLEVNGDQRFALGKKRLEQLLAGRVRHRLDSLQSMQAAMAKHKVGRESSAAASYPIGSGPQFESLKPGESIQDALQSRQFESLEEVNAFVQQHMGQYNDQPQDELGGLSPTQVSELMDCDWQDEHGPVRLSKSLSLHELADSHFLNNARLLLTQCQQRGGIKATSAGYLDTKFVREFVQAMSWPERLTTLVKGAQQGRMREMGVPQLYSLRLVAEFSGLIKKRSGQFSITQQGEKFLLEENAGRLLNRLFVVHCQEFNLDFYDRLRLEHPEVQHAVAFSLYKLGQLDDGAWHALGEAIPALMLPIVRHAITRQEDPLLWNELQVEGVIQAVSQRFLEPMESFGLLELDNTWEATGLLTEESRVRLTPLFGKFINFQL